jgi:hypothetical protein
MIPTQCSALQSPSFSNWVLCHFWNIFAMKFPGVPFLQLNVEYYFLVKLVFFQQKLLGELGPSPSSFPWLEDWLCQKVSDRF